MKRSVGSVVSFNPPARGSRLLRAVGVLALLSCSVACSQLRPFRVKASVEPHAIPAARSDTQQQSRPDIPLSLGRDDDFVVRLVVGSVTCSGTLFEEDRVLTAHHCVSARNKYGDFENKNVSPKEVRVEIGGDYMPWDDVGVRAIVSPPCGYAAGEGDIAVLVLDKKLRGMKVAKLRLDEPPRMKEEVDPAGFGRCGLSTDAIRRRDRTGGHIDKIYESRFRTNAAICPGDSGGPAIGGSSGEVVGIISAAAMDGSESTRDRAEFTRIDRWRAVFSTAALIAEGASSNEVPPVDGCPAP